VFAGLQDFAIGERARSAIVEVIDHYHCANEATCCLRAEDRYRTGSRTPDGIKHRS